MENLEYQFIYSCESLIQSHDDIYNEEKVNKHKEGLEKINQIVSIIKNDVKLDKSFLMELLHNSNEVVRIQAARVMLFDLKYKKGHAIRALKQIKKHSMNKYNTIQSNLILKKQEGYFYSILLVNSLYITLLLILFLGLYYNVIIKNHVGPMDLWATILLIADISIYLIIISITRFKKITLFDGTDKTIKYGTPIILLRKLAIIIKRIKGITKL